MNLKSQGLGDSGTQNPHHICVRWPVLVRRAPTALLDVVSSLHKREPTSELQGEVSGPLSSRPEWVPFTAQCVGI